MPLHRNSSQKKIREAEKPQRVAAVRNAPATTTMAAAAAVSPDKPLTEKQKLYAVATVVLKALKELDLQWPALVTERFKEK